nr:hypothetical protein [Clostridiales bacterium]
PKKDYSTEETVTLKSYVENGGKMFIATNLITKEEFPNIYAFLEGYGIKLVDGYILEKDANMYLSSYSFSSPFYLLPDKADHEITAQFANYYLLFPGTQGFEISEDLPEGVSVDSLLTSSDKAFATTDYETRESADFKDGDIKPESVFNVGAVIHVNSGDEGENSGVIVYYSCSTFINSQINSVVGGTNSALAVSSMSYLNGKKASVNIPSKSLEMQPLSFSAQQVTLFTILLILVIPIAVLVTGIVVWARRRKR